MRLRVVLTMVAMFLTSIGLVTSPVTAQNTVEDVLDNALQDLGTRCFPGNAGRRFRDANDAKDLVTDEAELSLPVEEFSGSSLAALFRFVFLTRSLNDWRNNSNINTRFLEMDARDFQPDRDFDNVYYLSSCMSMLKTAINAETGGNVPTASIRAAVNLEFDRTGRQDLSIMRGRFLSPLGRALRSSGAERVRANMLIWDYYADRNAKPANAAFLDAVTGWLVITVRDMERRTSGSLNANAGGNWMVASVNATVEARAQTNEQLVANGFRVYILSRPTTQASWDTLPSPAAIGKVLSEEAQYQAHPDPSLRYAAQGTVQQHLQVISGVPTEACALAQWNSTVTSTQPTWGTLRLASVAPISPGSAQCAFTVRFTSMWDNIPPSERADGTIDLEYTITNQRRAGTERLTLVAHAPVQTSDQPVVQPPRTAVPTEVATNLSQMRMRVPFTILDDLVAINRQAFGTGTRVYLPTQLECGSWKTNIQTYVVHEGGGLYYLEGEHVFGLDPQNRPTAGNCSISLDLLLPRSSGGSVTRSFSAPISIDLTKLPTATPAVSTPPS